MPDITTQPAEDFEPIVCDMSAIPADERDAHVDLARSLFFAPGRMLRETDNGIETDVSAERLGDVARFIENERRCCRHLAFDLRVPARGAPLTLRVSGPGAREELAALVRES